jgi:putative peptidoglycan lipid II flippase
MSSAHEKQKITRAASVVGLATLASRIGGFIRDMVIAYYFGTQASADSFFVAFRIPNLLRRLFAEGTLTIAFIPVFTEVLQKKGKEEAFLLARSTYGVLALTLLLVSVLGVVFAEQVVQFVAMGFAKGSQAFSLSVYLTRFCFPYIFFISLVALAGGVLNSMGHFFAPASAPVLLNICIIGSAVALAPVVDPPVLSLALGVLLGGVCQLALQVPYLRQKGVPLTPKFNLKNPALRKVGRLMGPAAFGAAVYQITVLMNTMLASYLPSGSVSYLYYADRLIQFPLGIFAIALSTAVLPSLSRQAAQDDQSGMMETMGYALRLTLFINLPAMVGLIVLAEPVVTLLFSRGEFSAQSASATANALMAYGLGLWAIAGTRSVVSAFYALKDTKTPVKVAAVCLLINLGFSLALMGPLAHVGLALATSISAMANLGGLVYLLRRKVGPMGGRRILDSLLRMILASGFMGVIIYILAYWIGWGADGSVLHKIVRPLVAVMAGIIVYMAAARMLGSREIKSLLNIFWGRLKKNA